MQNTKKVLIDGALGFLGKHLTNEFITKGYQVKLTDLASFDNKFKSENAVFVNSNLLDEKSLEIALDGVEYVVHAAAAFDLSLSKETLHNINVIGTKNLCKISALKKIKHFIHVSTADSYGRLKTIPADENHPQNPVNDYSISKLEAEKVALEFFKKGDLNVTVLRPSVLYGPYSKYIAALFFAIPVVLKHLGIKRLPFFKINTKFTLVHVSDVAGACEFLCGKEKSFGETYNICESEIISKGEFMNGLLENFGFKNLITIPIYKPIFNAFFSFILALPEWAIARPLNNFVNKYWKIIFEKHNLNKDFVPHFVKNFFTYFVGDHAYSNEKIRTLGYQIKYPSFLSELNNTLKWYRDNKWLPPL